MRKIKEYTIKVAFGDGSNEEGLFRTQVEVEAFTERGARKKAIEIVAKRAVLEVSAGRYQGVNPVFTQLFGENFEQW